MSESASLLYENGRYEEALEEARRRLGEDPDDARTLSIAGLSLVRLGRHDEARTTIDAAVAGAPEQSWAHYSRGVVLTAFEDKAEAHAALDRALELDPRNARALTLKAALMSSDDPPRALELAEHALRLDPHSEWTRRVHAEVLGATGRTEEAKQELERLIGEYPEQAKLFLSRARLALDHGDPEDALPFYQEALRLDPELPGVLWGLFECMKARHPLYRPYFRCETFMRRRPRTAQIGVSTVAVAFFMVLVNVPTDASPSLLAAIHLAFLVLVVTVYLGWVGRPAFNVLLFTDKVARRAMQPWERAAGGLFALSVVLALGFFAANFAAGRPWPAWMVLLSGLFLASPLWGAVTRNKRWTTWVAGVSAALVGGLFLMGGVWTLVPGEENAKAGTIVAGLSMLAALKNRWLLSFLRIAD